MPVHLGSSRAATLRLFSAPPAQLQRGRLLLRWHPNLAYTPVQTKMRPRRTWRDTSSLGISSRVLVSVSRSLSYDVLRSETRIVGIQIVLWWTCVNYLWKERRRSWRTILLIAYLSLLLAVDFVFCIVQARTVQVIYVENRNYPGGPWQYFLDTQYLAINVVFYSTLFVGTFLCDLLVVCPVNQRCNLVTELNAPWF